MALSLAVTPLCRVWVWCDSPTTKDREFCARLLVQPEEIVLCTVSTHLAPQLLPYIRALTLCIQLSFVGGSYIFICITLIQIWTCLYPHQSASFSYHHLQYTSHGPHSYYRHMCLHNREKGASRDGRLWIAEHLGNHYISGCGLNLTATQLLIVVTQIALIRHTSWVPVFSSAWWDQVSHQTQIHQSATFVSMPALNDYWCA